MQHPTIDTNDTYKKRYRMQTVGRDGATTIVAIPPQVIDREAERRHMTTEEFIKKHRAVAHFNNFDGIFYTFEEVEDK